MPCSIRWALAEAVGFSDYPQSSSTFSCSASGKSWPLALHSWVAIHSIEPAERPGLITYLLTLPLNSEGKIPSNFLVLRLIKALGS